MLHTTTANRGMVVAPHHLAAQAGLDILREGGNAIEAMIAAAATIAVVYPHMNSLGGDNFWLLCDGGEARAIEACGPAAAAATPDFYHERGHDRIPARGPLAANTVAGAVSGWQAALELSRGWGGRIPLARLLEDACHHARHGFPVSSSQGSNTAAKAQELAGEPGFAETFLHHREPPAAGMHFSQAALADTLERLGRAGLDDFYRGELARTVAGELERLGSPLRLGDLEGYAAREVTPLALELHAGTLYNLPPPTQGLASLLLLGIFERLDVSRPEGFAHVHGLIEATKQAFRVRDRHVTDPAWMTADPAAFLEASAIDAMAARIDAERAMPWGQSATPGDTVWLGAVDADGRAVSFIQSIFWEFGSGVVLRDSGITWQNRGASFDLDADARNALVPGRRPFHTIQPAMARLADGRLMAYGAMGGEGQPQTQAAVYTRHVMFGQPLQTAVSAPRWLLGRTWGAETTNLRIESRFPAELIEALRAAGHDVEPVAEFDAIMGHAGALVRHPHGLIEGAADPRSDGGTAAF